MTGRLHSGLIVNALLRRVAVAGGFAAILARGDDGAGAWLFVTLDRGASPRLWEAGRDSDGKPALVPVGPTDDDAQAVTAYWQRRRERDPDLWVIELDVADAKRFAAETIAAD